MSSIAIHVENLSKSYLIGHDSQKSSGSFREQMTENTLNLLKKYRDVLKGKPIISGDTIEEFWSLRDLNLTIRKGDRVGVIGRNGAGKSTLLKILSRITEPTSGRIKVNGRIASLLEVGTGFHPELSGRENIYLNGSILGMSKKDIARQFDEIVAFSEIERFLDTPVKRYSSGMYVRLAFAVASHLEPEILILDEVLAVGDANFQRKCLGKMDEVASEGRTILFVSHNMAMVSNLCNKGLVLDSGYLAFNGDISDAVIHYYKQMNVRKTVASRLFSSESAEMLSCGIVGKDDVNEVSVDEAFTIRMVYRLKHTIDGVCVPNFHFFTADGAYAFVSTAEGVKKTKAGCYHADCHVPRHLLNEGAYFVGAALTTYPGNGTHHVEFFDRNAVMFNVVDPMDEATRPYDYLGPMPGAVRPHLNWTLGAYKE